MFTIETLMFFFVEFILLYSLIFYLNLFFEGNEKKKKLLRKPKVSILIPAYNEEKTIKKCISSVLNLDYPKEKLEVIVINDGSTDRTREIAESFGNKIKLINQKNQGKARAINNGLKISTGEFFACLDADSYVDKNSLKKILKHFDKDTAAVTPLMEVHNPKNILQKTQAIEYMIYIFIKKCMAKINSIFVTPGPFTVYRKKIIESIGGFDEKSIVEDQEIAYRLQKHHFKIEQSDDGKVYTEAPINLKEFYRQRNRWARGTIQTIYKYKNLIFNPKYGDFGLFQLPMNLFGLILPFITLYFLFKFLFLPIYNSLSTLILTNFSFLFSFPDLIQTFLGLNFSTIFLNFLYLGLFIFAGKKAYQVSNEKFKRKDIIPGIFFFLFFYILTGFITLIAFYHLLTNKREKW